MITGATLHDAGGIDLLRALSYDPQPIAIAPDEWRRAGIDIGWTHATSLAVRLDQLDVYVVDGGVTDDQARAFLRALASYNVAVKPVLFARGAIYDLSPRRELRRLDLNGSPHAIDRLNLLAAGDDPARLFERALDRETLTRQFFERFRAAVRDVASALAAQCPDESQEAIDGQALLLLSRLLFLYFIQQKGWLNGERRFLIDRLDRALHQQRDFFASVLLPLFFGCLNTPHGERKAAAKKLGAVPYLNGGLFEPSAFELRHRDIALDNDLMRRVIEEVFECFAFSVDESDAAGTHIDPEMLGRVFESLMAGDERAASGSFYTPRAIVDVLTSRAIETWCASGGELESITVLDPACGSGAFLLSALRTIERLMLARGLTPSRRQIVERCLFGVDLKPEAVRLCELRLWLAIVSTSDVSIDDVQPLPNLDRNILQGNSLLTPTDFLGDGRADIYRDWVHALRAQQDLVSRYRTAAHGERPALARMIRAHDCSLAEEMLHRAVAVDERELEETTAPQRDLFGRLIALDNVRCRELQERIRDHRKLLDRAERGELAFFSFEIHFAPVMARGGFDVVVGNPPWVRNGRIEARTKRMLTDRYRWFSGNRAERAAFHQPDLSIAFFERALALANERGVVSLLVPSKLLSAGYASELRRSAEEQLSIVALDDWSDDARKHFDADTFPLGVTVRKKRDAARSIHVTASGRSFSIPQRHLPLLGDEWSLVPHDVATIIARLRVDHFPLAETLGRAPVMGVKSGANGAFFLDVAATRGKTLITRDDLRVPVDATCRCVRGRDVRRWSLAEGTTMLWPPPGGWKKPPRWLQRFADARAIDVRELRLSYVRPEHAGIKVVWKDLSRGLAAAVADQTVIPNQTLYVLDATSLDEAHMLAALLNSTIVNCLTICIAERAKDFHFRYFGRTLARIPLPRVAPNSEAWTRLARCARRGRDGAQVMAEVDAVAAELYGVTPAEHELLARFVACKLGHIVDD